MTLLKVLHYSFRHTSFLYLKNITNMKQHYRKLLESISHSAFLICKEKTMYPNKQLEKFSIVFMKHTFV